VFERGVHLYMSSPSLSSVLGPAVHLCRFKPTPFLSLRALFACVSSPLGMFWRVDGAPIGRPLLRMSVRDRVTSLSMGGPAPGLAELGHRSLVGALYPDFDALSPGRLRS